MNETAVLKSAACSSRPARWPTGCSSQRRRGRRASSRSEPPCGGGSTTQTTRRGAPGGSVGLGACGERLRHALFPTLLARFHLPLSRPSQGQCALTGTRVAEPGRGQCLLEAIPIWPPPCHACATKKYTLPTKGASRNGRANIGLEDRGHPSPHALARDEGLGQEPLGRLFSTPRSQAPSAPAACGC